MAAFSKMFTSYSGWPMVFADGIVPRSGLDAEVQSEPASSHPHLSHPSPFHSVPCCPLSGWVVPPSI